MRVIWVNNRKKKLKKINIVKVSQHRFVDW